MIRKAKIALIGGGNIGGTIAHIITERELGDVVIFDINSNIVQGKALDIAQSTSITKSSVNVIGTSNPADIRDADVVVVTAGVTRKPGMTRDDLVSTNAKIIMEVSGWIKQYTSNAFVIIVTNPLDVMVWCMWKYSGLSTNKLVGMAGVLDSARFNYFLSQEFNVSVEDVSSFVLGTHGDNMLPLVRYSTIAGIPVMDLVKMGWSSEQKIKSIVERTKNGGGEIVELMKTGSAYYAPANSVVKMMQSYLQDKKRILPCAAYVENNYGVQNLFVGVPVVIGANGVEKIIEVELTEEEKLLFQKSSESIQELINNFEL